MFFENTGRKLNLDTPKTFNEKIQWLKLYDSTPLKTKLTDKVLVRDFIQEKIGKEYLKPVLWIGNNFDEIPFDELPNAFIIKTNHGCKWHFRIKNKTKFLENEGLKNFVRTKFRNWMNSSYYVFSGFELQYKNIVPQILIEPLFYDDIEAAPTEIETYCFNGVPKIFQKVKYTKPNKVCIYNENYDYLNLKFVSTDIVVQEEPDDKLNLAAELSRELAQNFKFVRIDWLINNDKIYFNEMTFIPFSGYYFFEDENWNYQLGQMINLQD